jgi:hypothetical protein
MMQTTPHWVVPFAVLAAVWLAVYMLFHRRTRTAFVVMALIILGTMALGFVGVRGSARVSQPQAESNIIVAQMAEQQAMHQQAIAEMQVEILKNQRMAASMGDAMVQGSPDGSTLDTYPDEMQIKQLPQTMERRLSRPADKRLQSRVELIGIHSRTSGGINSWILIAPMVALLVAFLALRSARRHGRLPSAVWGAAGIATMLLLTGLYMVRSDRSQMPPPTRIMHSPPQVVQSAEMAAAYQDVIESYETLQQSVSPSESLEKLWARMTQPKIKLEESAKGAATAAKVAKTTEKELAAAAKLVLSASVPGADPFTQGWLANAAKAIIEASAKASQKESRNAEAIQAALAAQAAPRPKLKVIPVSQPAKSSAPPKARPDWIDNPPTLVGNTRRVVVSTDPYSTVEECYEALREQMRQAVQMRIAEKVRDANGDMAPYVPPLEMIGITTDYILTELCPEGEYIETVNSSVGEMKAAYALLEFTEPQDEILLDHWRAYARHENMGAVAGISTLLVSGLALVYGLLKVDTWTRGYYTKRLFLGVPAAIIGLIAAIAACLA